MVNNTTIAPQNRTINPAVFLSSLEHEIVKMQVAELLPAAGGQLIKFPKINSIKKHVKDYSPLQ